MRRLVMYAAILAMVAGLVTAVASGSGAQPRASATSTLFHNRTPVAHWCNTNGITCAEPYQNWKNFPWFDKIRSAGVHIQEYIGHDEPSALFYSNTPGSGNDNTYNLMLPKDPAVVPAQDQSGGTWNFQLHPAFWFGMAICDNQSAPNPAWSGAAYPNNACAADSDSNIYTSTNSSNANYIGKHPGVAFMEMQFYPPGWVKWPVGNSCDATQWCAALNIDSLSEDMNTGTPNNTDCLNSAGIEPVNFAFLTKTGVATAAANPLDYANSFNLVPSKDFFMNSGDALSLHMSDTSDGFTVTVNDLTTGGTGKMVASAANGFGSVHFDPNASTCSVDIHAFHPAYSTSSPATRVTWTAHSYNIAYSDEIGHFEYCQTPVADGVLSCATTANSGFATNNVDLQDMNYCLPIPGYPPSNSSLIKVKGCLGVLGDSDVDFDGASYDARSWPGSTSSQTVNKLLAPTPIMFTSPTTTGGAAFSQAAFETDLSRIEDNRGDLYGGVLQYCQRFKDGTAPPPDPSPGAGCYNPPPQSRFYPFFSTTQVNTQCWWQEGGAYLPATTNTFGGEQAEYGKLLELFYPESPPGSLSGRLNDYRRILSTNPCT